MAAARPFPMLADLYNDAEHFWFSLKPADWHEAFVSGSEASSVESTRDQRDFAKNGDYAEIIRLYVAKFRFAFVVCESGRSPEEIFAICAARLSNSADTELLIASHEQQKITEINLNRVLEQ